MILHLVSDLLTDRRQLKKLLSLGGRLFGRFSK
jgi:hypothetical protein